jgi:hypothetical protein
MSHRPIARKRGDRMRKALRHTPDRYFNLIEWLCDHGHAQTAGQARKIILARRVRSDSHVLGIRREPVLVPADGKKVNPFDKTGAQQREMKVEVQDVCAPVIPVALRENLQVLAHAPEESDA